MGTATARRKGDASGILVLTDGAIYDLSAKARVEAAAGREERELLDTELSTKVATGRPTSAPACARGNVSRALQCAAKSS